MSSIHRCKLAHAVRSAGFSRNLASQRTRIPLNAGLQTVASRAHSIRYSEYGTPNTSLGCADLGWLEMSALHIKEVRTKEVPQDRGTVCKFFKLE